MWDACNAAQAAKDGQTSHASACHPWEQLLRFSIPALRIGWML